MVKLIRDKDDFERVVVSDFSDSADELSSVTNLDITDALSWINARLGGKCTCSYSQSKICSVNRTVVYRVLTQYTYAPEIPMNEVNQKCIDFMIAEGIYSAKF